VVPPIGSLAPVNWSSDPRKLIAESAVLVNYSLFWRPSVRNHRMSWSGAAFLRYDCSLILLVHGQEAVWGH